MDEICNLGKIGIRFRIIVNVLIFEQRKRTIFYGCSSEERDEYHRTMRRELFDLIAFSNGYIRIIFGLAFLSSSSISQLAASIHQYQNESFIHRSNSFFFHGGSEGLYASNFHPPSSNFTDYADKSLHGMTFIR